MYILNGFMTVNSFQNHNPANVSVIGELSAHSRSFSREVANYTNSTYPDVRLTSFVSELDDVLVPVDPDYRDLVLQIGQWMFGRSVAGVFTADRDTAQQLVANQFASAITLTGFGIMVTNGTYWLPESISFEVIDGDANRTRIWFSDTAFRAQYDKYEIIVVPPIMPLDDFHRDRGTVLALIEAITPSNHLTLVETARGGIPDTLTIPNPYDWVDKNDSTIKRETPWTVITYGNAANNADIIKQTIVDYILANSDYPREDWEVIFPDLFLPTEYFITPLWDRYALPNQQTQGGLYSPGAKVADLLHYATSTFFEYPIQHIIDNYSIVPTTYKNIPFVFVGNYKNRNDIFDFFSLWPDYVTISMTSLDFNRVDPRTRDFILLLTRMLIEAEIMTEFSDVPVGLSRVKRGANYFVSASYEKVQYLVSVKANVLPAP